MTRTEKVALTEKGTRTEKGPRTEQRARIDKGTWTDGFGVSPTEAEHPRRRRVLAGVSTEAVVFVLFVAGLAWLPFWFGSNRMIPWGVNALIFPGLAVLYELSLLLRGKPHPVPLKRVRLAALFFAAAVLWALVQNATWIPASWQHPIWQLAAEVLDRPVTGSISVDRSLTAVALVRLITAASVFWLALQLSREANRARMLIWSVVGIGAFYAAIGIFALGLMPNGRVFAELSPSKVLTSTFVNQNHYVTYAGIGFLAAVGLILQLYRRQFRRTGHLLRLKIAALISTTGGQAAVPLILALVILTALMLTGSRGGILSTALGFLVLLALNVRREQRASRQEALMLVFAAVVVGGAFVGFSDVFVGRVGADGLYEQGRAQVFKVTILSILASPVLGFGYDTFSSAFPMFHDESVSIWNFWDKAYNSYLEVLQGLGLLFGGMLIACLVVLVRDCLKGARIRQRDATYPAIAASVSFLIGAHALVDFSLQIQAVTLTYMAILGAGVAQARDDLPADRAGASVANSTRSLPIRG